MGATEIQADDGALTLGACCDGESCTDDVNRCDCVYICDVFKLQGQRCYADCDGNGVVNVSDRGFISANVGLNSATMTRAEYDLMCLYDLDGNGVINVSDRGFVSANIGLCTELPDWQNGSGYLDADAFPPVVDARFNEEDFHEWTSCSGVTCGGGEAAGFGGVELMAESMPVGPSAYFVTAGGQQAAVLSASRRYTLVYASGGQAIAGFTLFSVGQAAGNGMSSASPAAAGPWADLSDFEFMDITQSLGHPATAYGYLPGWHRFGLVSNTISAPTNSESQSLTTITPAGVGRLNLNLITWDAEGNQVANLQLSLDVR